MTGPEFARNHGNDATTWTTADIETEINLAEIDAHKRRRRTARIYRELTWAISVLAAFAIPLTARPLYPNPATATQTVLTVLIALLASGAISHYARTLGHRLNLTHH